MTGAYGSALRESGSKKLQQIGDDIFEKTMIEFHSRMWSGRFVVLREADEGTKVASLETGPDNGGSSTGSVFSMVVMRGQVFCDPDATEDHGNHAGTIHRRVCDGADDIHLRNDIFSQEIEDTAGHIGTV